MKKYTFKQYPLCAEFILAINYEKNYNNFGGNDLRIAFKNTKEDIYNGKCKQFF